MRAEPNFGLAHRQVLGRRPELVRLAPSKGLPWWIGSWRDDRRFTAQQEAALIALGRDPVTALAMTVSREACIRNEIAPMIGSWIPVFQFDCPVLAARADGKVAVIGPDGSTRHVRADGWASRPTSHPYVGAWGF